MSYYIISILFLVAGNVCYIFFLYNRIQKLEDDLVKFMDKSVSATMKNHESCETISQSLDIVAGRAGHALSEIVTAVNFLSEKSIGREIITRDDPESEKDENTVIH